MSGVWVDGCGEPARVSPDRWYGRRVTTLPPIDVYEPQPDRLPNQPEET